MQADTNIKEDSREITNLDRLRRGVIYTFFPPLRTNKSSTVDSENYNHESNCSLHELPNQSHMRKKVSSKTTSQLSFENKIKE